MSSTSAIIVYLALISLAMILAGMCVFHFIGMIKGIKGAHIKRANMVAPFVFLLPHFFDPAGKYHRAKLALYFVLLFIDIVCLNIMRPS